MEDENAGQKFSMWNLQPLQERNAGPEKMQDLDNE